MGLGEGRVEGDGAALGPHRLFPVAGGVEGEGALVPGDGIGRRDRLELRQRRRGLRGAPGGAQRRRQRLDERGVAGLATEEPSQGFGGTLVFAARVRPHRVLEEAPRVERVLGIAPRAARRARGGADT